MITFSEHLYSLNESKTQEEFEELVEGYHWWDYDADVDSETSSSVLAVISAEEFDMKAKAFVPEKDFESVFSYVTTPEEITSAIENY